jgi:hypothetical protein
MTLKALTIAAAATGLLMAAGSGTADAHPRKGVIIYHDYHPHPRLFLYSSVGGCGYYYERWEETGFFYWKKKYYICKGWW